MLWNRLTMQSLSPQGKLGDEWMCRLLPKDLDIDNDEPRVDDV